MGEKIPRAETDRQTGDNFDPRRPDTWPRGMGRFIKVNVPSTADIVDAYRALREDERDERIATALAALSAPSDAQPAHHVAASTSTTTSSPADDEWLTLKQAAQLRGVSVKMLKEAIKSGELEGEYPARDGGKAYRVQRGKLMAWHPPPRRGKKPTPPTPAKRTIANNDQPPELLRHSLRFVKDGE